MKKYLVPVDGSELSRHVVDQAIEIAKAQESEVTLLTIIPENAIYYYGEYVSYEQSQKILGAQRMMHEESKKSSAKMLDDLGEKLSESNILLKKLVQSGLPAEEILKMTESGQYDMIIIGNRGFSPAKKLFLGSVSQRVLNEAQCPVLVVKK